MITQTDATGATDSTAYKFNAETNSFSFSQTDVALTGNFDADLGLTPGAGETRRCRNAG